MPVLTSVLRANYLFSTITGAGLVVASVALRDWIGVPQWLIVAVGVGLLPFAIFVRHVSRTLEPRLVLMVIGGDLAWVAAAVVILVGFPDSMTTAGRWVFGLVSLAVADFAFFQWRGLKAIS